MELIFVRHGEPHSEIRTDGSPADPPLTDLGHRQAAAVAAKLAAEPLDALYCSTMTRARQTADPILGATGLTGVYRDELREWGSRSSRYIGERDIRAAAGAEDPDIARLRNGLADDHGYRFRDRVAAEVERIIASHRGERVVVVCHGGVISAYASHILGAERVLLFGAAHASITRVFAQSSGLRSLHTVNEHDHIKVL
jgi:probable phosphoglycerate mutase